MTGDDSLTFIQGLSFLALGFVFQAVPSVVGMLTSMAEPPVLLPAH
jgi:hypothetical protein